MAADFIIRETGKFPLSIGTSLALEGLLGIHPTQPRQPTGVKVMSQLWLNVRTLVRNLYQAMKTADAKKIAYINAVNALMAEIQAIPQVLKDNHSTITPVLYVEDLKEFKWVFPNALLKQPKTTNQLDYKTYEDTVLSMLLVHLQEEKIPVMLIKRLPAVQRAQVVLFTHEPHHLLWKDAFDRLMLLESRTGKLKLYNEWYTKLNGVSEENPMPFNHYTLQVFGDNAVFDAQPKPIKDELKQLATIKKWTGLTTAQKMAADIYAVGSQGLKKNYALMRP